MPTGFAKGLDVQRGEKCKMSLDIGWSQSKKLPCADVKKILE